MPAPCHHAAAACSTIPPALRPVTRRRPTRSPPGSTLDDGNADERTEGDIDPGDASPEADGERRREAPRSAWGLITFRAVVIN
jgi:hypothetical protein